jgi:hypothetical protein
MPTLRERFSVLLTNGYSDNIKITVGWVLILMMLALLFVFGAHAIDQRTQDTSLVLRSI